MYRHGLQLALQQPDHVMQPVNAAFSVGVVNDLCMVSPAGGIQARS
jgi:hypothetical protein